MKWKNVQSQCAFMLNFDTRWESRRQKQKIGRKFATINTVAQPRGKLFNHQKYSKKKLFSTQNQRQKYAILISIFSFFLHRFFFSYHDRQVISQSSPSNHCQPVILSRTKKLNLIIRKEAKNVWIKTILEKIKDCSWKVDDVKGEIVCASFSTLVLN